MIATGYMVKYVTLQAQAVWIAMTSSLPMFYKSAVPLTPGKHRNLSLRENFGLGFTKQANAVPVNLIEMPKLCQTYPIAFSPNEDATPVALLGLRDNENMFVDDKGNWIDDVYIPAYIRRYPFIFKEGPEKEQFTLCVDEDFLEENVQARLFNEDGTPSPLTLNAMEFCKSSHSAAQETKAFSHALAESGLLVNQEVIIERGEKRIIFTGSRVIDEKKLAEMNDEVFLEWRNKGWLLALYAALLSGAQWKRLERLLVKRLEQECT